MHWDPLLNWVRSTFDVEIQKFQSILYNSQPEATKRQFDKLLARFDPWEMAGKYKFITSYLMGIDVIRAKQWSVRHIPQNHSL